MERVSMKDGTDVLRSGISGVLHSGGHAAALETTQLMKEIGVTDQHLKLVMDSKKEVWSKAGTAAELLHAESFNLDAIVKESNVRAHTDVHVGTPIRRNDTVVDIILTGGESPSVTTQSKCCRTPDDTATAMRELVDGAPKYGDANVLLIPSDQLEGVQSSARRAELKSAQTRP